MYLYIHTYIYAHKNTETHCKDTALQCYRLMDNQTSPLRLPDLCPYQTLTLLSVGQKTVFSQSNCISATPPLWCENVGDEVCECVCRCL